MSLADRIAGAPAPAAEPGAYAGAALVPGMPHLLAQQPAPAWEELAAAVGRVGDVLRAERPDVLVVLSTQWFTVLGHQLQLDPHVSGTRVDENWYAYDYGTLPYDLRFDVELAEQWALELEDNGLQARRTRYDGFPIDTGLIVAQKLLDPDATLPLAQVSCNLYAGAEDLAAVGAAAMRAASACGRRAALVAVSGLSSALTQRWIDPSEDRIERRAHAEWDRRILDLLRDGRLAEVMRLREQYAAEASVDSQLRALAFLAGSGHLNAAADVHAYGPVWGTGCAVIHWPPTGSSS